LFEKERILKDMNEIDLYQESTKRRISWLASFIFTFLVVGLAACVSVNTEAFRNSSPAVSKVSPPSMPSRQDKSPQQSPIRQVDFSNFIYPSLPTGKCSMEQVQLRDGRYDAPEHIKGKLTGEDCWSVAIIYADYGDVNGDGVEEAIIVLYAEVGGNESSQDVFIYTLQGEHPKLLWKFATGDGADGGLKRIYANRGNLVIELYGVETKIGKKLYGTNPAEVGSCCPKNFTMTTYKWMVDHFQQDGESTVFSNPSGSAATDMPRYQLRKE
jgi:hypothetical protein